MNKRFLILISSGLLILANCEVLFAQDADNPGLAREDAAALQNQLASKGVEFVEKLAEPFEDVIAHDEKTLENKEKPQRSIVAKPVVSQSGSQVTFPHLDDSDASIMADIDQLEGTPAAAIPGASATKAH